MENKIYFSYVVLKTFFQALYLEINPWNLLWVHKGKTLKSQLLKKLSIKFFETQDLSSTNGKRKLLFYDYSWHIFFLQPITEGNCVQQPIKEQLIAKISDFILHWKTVVQTLSLCAKKSSQLKCFNCVLKKCLNC